MSKCTKGVTLLELVIALGLWLILSAGVFFLWQHTSGSTENIMQRQAAFERARTAMDMMIANIEFSYRVTIRTDAQGRLNTMVTRGYMGNVRHNYEFQFRPGYQDLRFNSAGHFQMVATGISAIYVTYTNGRRINILIHTNCDEPVVLHGSVDVRYKYVLTP